MQASNITNPVTFATSKTRLTVFTNTVLLFLDMSFVSVKTERKLFVYNMHLKQLNLQQSMQLKCHYFGISGIKTKNKFIKCLTAWFHDQIRKNLQILLNISRRSNVTVFIENATKVSTTKSRLPQFGNSLQCESSGKKRQAKFAKSEMN